MPNITFFRLLLCAWAILPLALDDAVGQQDATKTRYVSDYLKINLKDRLEKPYEVVTTVQSDDPVQLLEESDNYWKISTPDGKEGWIAKHYLKSDPPKSTIIKQLRQENSDLKAQLTTLAASKATGASDDSSATDPSFAKEFEEKLKAAEKTISALQQKLAEAQSSPSPGAARAGAGESLEATSENHAWLVEEYEKRGEQIEELQKSLAQKEDRTRFMWFAAGALVFIVGLLAGKTGSRKKNKLLY